VLKYQPYVKDNLLRDSRPEVAALILETLLVSSTERDEIKPLLQTVDRQVILRLGVDGWGVIRERLGFDKWVADKAPNQTVLEAINEFESISEGLGFQVLGRLLQFPPRMFQHLSDRSERGEVIDFEPRAVERLIAQRNYSELPPQYRKIVEECSANCSEVLPDDIQRQVETELSAYLLGRREMPDHFKIALGDLFEELDNAPAEKASEIVTRLQEALKAQLERELVLLNQYGQRNLEMINSRLRDQFVKEKIGYISEQVAFSLLNDEEFRTETGILAVYKSSKWSHADMFGGDLIVVMRRPDEGEVSVWIDVKSRAPEPNIGRDASRNSFLPPFAVYRLENEDNFRLICWPAEVVVILPDNLEESRQNLRNALSAGVRTVIEPW
jgi:hypothetical protein